MTTEFLSVDTFIERYQSAPFPGVSWTESEIKEWVFEILNRIGTSNYTQRMDTKIDIISGRGKLPSNIEKLIEIVEGESNYPMIQLIGDQRFRDLSYKLNTGYIYTDFSDGYVIVSYYGSPLDEDNKPLIPKNEYFISAVDAFIRYKMAIKAWVTKKLSLNEVQALEADVDFYTNGARGDSKKLNHNQVKAFAKIRNRY